MANKINDLPEDLKSAPEYLTPNSKTLWEHCIRSGQFPGAIERVLLQRFCTVRDILGDIRKRIEAEGDVFRDRWGQPRENPLCKLEREAAAELGRLFRSLGFDQQPPAERRLR